MVRSEMSKVPVELALRSQAGGAASFFEAQYFDVPFEDNGLAKALGLKWDSNVRKWFAASAEVAAKFHDATTQLHSFESSPSRTYFKVHFLQKDRAKQLGMLFDGSRKLWFAPTAEIAALGRQLFMPVEQSE